MEYELHVDGTLTPLPKQNVDTGLGLERTAAILQDVRSVYDSGRLPDDHELDRGRERRLVDGATSARRRRTASSPTTAAG